MTQANGKQRGRGKPRSFDEDELVARIKSLDDLQRIQTAVMAIGASSIEARGLGGMLLAKKAGDPTGGVGSATLTRYRRLLAELPFDPLTPAPRRRRKTRSQRGSADLRLLATAAGSGALAMTLVEPLSAVLRALPSLPPIIPVM